LKTAIFDGSFFEGRLGQGRQTDKPDDFIVKIFGWWA
jgi:hypothetical protein